MPETMPGSIDKAVRDLQGYGKLIHTHVIPARQAASGALERELPKPLAAYLQARNMTLYSHQCETINLLRGGENVIITTPTASGKTLAFSLPVMESMMEDAAGRALFLYPTKALANDQLKFLSELERLTGINVSPRVYDGDTPAGRRPAIRDRSRIIISNLHELHHVLPWHYKWEKFFRGLKYIVLDEAHRYRGVLGSNVAYLLRRLRRVCRHYGADPRFVLSTATLANPMEFSASLVGAEFRHVSQNGAPSGRKYFLLVNPYNSGPLKAKDDGSSTHAEAKNLFVHFIRSGLQTICFTGSRKMAELISLWAGTDLERTDPDLAGSIAAYRAGYLPEERRKLENDLKNGTLRGVTSTNALELGIDIGSLDAVIISGYPGTAISTWQQAGRSGRGKGQSIAALVAYEDALDQYFIRNPEVFFDRPPEHAVVDLANPHICAGHIMCAAAEIPVDIEKDRDLLGPETGNVLSSLGSHGLVARTARGWVYSGKARPAEVVSLDGAGSEIFTLVTEARTLGTMDLNQAYREAHEGAVLVHQGETYIVERLDLKDRIACAKKAQVDYYTVPLKSADLRITGELRRKMEGDIPVTVGNIAVTERYTGYKVIRQDKVLGVRPLSLPPLEFNTVGLWFTVRDEIGEDIRKSGLVFGGGLHGIEHAMISIIPFHVLCDRHDLGGLSAPFHPDTLKPTIFVYDGFEGGIGIAERAYDLFPEIFKMTFDLIRECPCDDGCPACIYSPKCGNDNRPLDKTACVEILAKLSPSRQGFQI